MQFGSKEILNALKETAANLEWNGDIEILLVGGVAAMLTGQLPAERVTQDCDIINLSPKQAQKAILNSAREVARIKGLPENWLNCQAMQLDVLPDGWRSRREYICKYDQLSIYAASRLDMLCMKFYANRPQDREDIMEMKPKLEETCFVRKYLDMLKLPSRHADLDQIVTALKLIDTIEEVLDEC
ncbi:MAG: hypothetical protein FVQ82_11060 [Planctomycetes bacterium]|nr:hypothetical protein [Planctomycetota bacterium]